MDLTVSILIADIRAIAANPPSVEGVALIWRAYDRAYDHASAACDQARKEWMLTGNKEGQVEYWDARDRLDDVVSVGECVIDYDLANSPFYKA